MLLELPLGHVPKVCSSSRFLLEPQSLDHAELDYLAVMSSKDHLRRWSFSEWPEDSFTLEQNKKDLEAHVQEAREGLAYGFTIFSPGRDQVWGSLYLNPIRLFESYYSLTDHDRELFTQAKVEVDYWLLEHLESDFLFQQEFTRAVQQWLRQSWGYETPLWGTRHSLTQRHIVYEALEMRERMRLKSTNPPARFMLFHSGPSLDC